MSACRQPCKTCPWRVDQDGAEIPSFSLGLAEDLAATSRHGGYGPEFGDPMFACHQSREGEEIVCAGWLAREGSAHPNARMMGIAGVVPMEAFHPGEDWPELEPDFESVITKLRETHG